jgi:hypothetical protein
LLSVPFVVFFRLEDAQFVSKRKIFYFFVDSNPSSVKFVSSLLEPSQQKKKEAIGCVAKLILVIGKGGRFGNKFRKLQIRSTIPARDNNSVGI